jgi:hypothetical protein
LPGNKKERNRRYYHRKVADENERQALRARERERYAKLKGEARERKLKQARAAAKRCALKKRDS